MELPFIRKVVTELPTKVDPNFDVKFNEAKHGAYIKENLNTNHMSPRKAARLTAAIKDNWMVFKTDGVKHTIIGYECDIDTGNARPISCGNVNYGPRESKVMEKHISVLVQMKHSYQIYHS